VGIVQDKMYQTRYVSMQYDGYNCFLHNLQNLSFLDVFVIFSSSDPRDVPQVSLVWANSLGNPLSIKPSLIKI